MRRPRSFMYQPGRVSFVRGYRRWHWLPRVYGGVNGCTTRIVVWGWWSLEVDG